MTKPTKGQWRIFKDASSIEWIKNADNESIAYLGGFAGDSERALMVAAPELLAALETAVASGKSWRGISAARAAIAKARGETL